MLSCNVVRAILIDYGYGSLCVAEGCNYHTRVLISQLWNWSHTSSRSTFHYAVGRFSSSSLTRSNVSLICKGLYGVSDLRGIRNFNIRPYYRVRRHSASPKDCLVQKHKKFKVSKPCPSFLPGYFSKERYSLTKKNHINSYK